MSTWYMVRLAVLALLRVAFAMALGLSSHCWVADEASQSCRSFSSSEDVLINRQETGMCSRSAKSVQANEAVLYFHKYGLSAEHCTCR